MITIYTTAAYRKNIETIIQREYRLDELVVIKDLSVDFALPVADHITVDETGIKPSIDWYNVAPPYLFPQQLTFYPNVLLAFIYLRLDNFEKLYTLLNDHNDLFQCFDEYIRFAQGAEVTLRIEGDYLSYHNAAVFAHYGNVKTNQGNIPFWYTQALQLAPNDEVKAFTAKHYATWLADVGDFAAADDILNDAVGYALTTEASTELKTLQVSVWLNSLSVPYDEAKLERIKANLQECLAVYERANRQLQIGLLLLDATRVATLSNSFTEALGYVSRASDIFRHENLPELFAQAQMSKGTLLYTWAQQGNPQFYKGAMESLQEAAKVFTRNEAPQQFAEIQHLLGIIYSEIPDEAKKKSVWAAVSSSSFKEALNFFNKEEYPYEYATVCNHYGNAYVKYPASRNSDTIVKALELFNEALTVRTTEQYPVERALTLLNYLEASWYADNGSEEFNEIRYNDMMSKVEELLTLETDDKIRGEALIHQQRLDELRKVSEKEYNESLVKELRLDSNG